MYQFALITLQVISYKRYTVSTNTTIILKYSFHTLVDEYFHFHRLHTLLFYISEDNIVLFSDINRCHIKYMTAVIISSSGA